MIAPTISAEEVARAMYEARPGRQLHPVVCPITWDEAQADLPDRVAACRRDAETALALIPSPQGGEAWQPIETAPRDGAWVSAWRAPPSWTGPTWEPLIYVRWDADEGSWVWPCDAYQVFTVRGRELADMAIDEGDFYTAEDFTHWRPLPTSPVVGEK